MLLLHAHALRSGVDPTSAASLTRAAPQPRDAAIAQRISRAAARAQGLPRCRRRGLRQGARRLHLSRSCAVYSTCAARAAAHIKRFVDVGAGVEETAGGADAAARGRVVEACEKVLVLRRKGRAHAVWTRPWSVLALLQWKAWARER